MIPTFLADSIVLISVIYHRAAFLSGPLFYVSRAQPKKEWIRFDDVVWSGPRVIRSKVPLKAIYPSLEDLFRSKLRVNDPSDDVLLVAELLAIAKEWENKKIPETVKDHTLEMLFEVSTLIRRNGPHSASPGWLELLRGKPIFPVDDPSKGLILSKPGDRFYVSDSPAYEDMFYNLLPILSLPRKWLPRIKHLLESGLFTPGARYLESAVRRTSVSSGHRIVDHAATKHYASRLGYIQR